MNSLQGNYIGGAAISNRQPQVSEQLSVLDTSIDGLRKELAELYERCNPIICASPEEPDKTCGQPVAMLCPLAERIRGANDAIAKMSRSVSLLKQSMEV